MQDLPHRYPVEAEASAEGSVTLRSGSLPVLESTAPPEFGGPPGQWSPETLLVAAVVDCFVLSFRAIARASSLSWSRLVCRGEGVLDRVEGKLRFTEIMLRAQLDVPAGTDVARAQRLLAKAEASCLISNSLSATTQLESEVRIGA